MPRRTSFAEVSRAVTKKTNVKSELRKRASSTGSQKLKRKDTSRSLKNSDTPRLDDVQEQETAEDNKTESETTPEAEAADKGVSLAEESEAAGEALADGEGENDAEVVILGEEALAEDAEHGEEEDEEGEDKKKEDEKEEEHKNEGDTPRKGGQFKRLTKKQLRLQEEQLEEEREREERRKRREERKRKKELQAELAQQEAPQSFDEAAFKKSIYTMVKSSLGLVMVNEGDLNITVDNLTPLMKGLELDTGDEDVKELIMEALLNSYGLIEPSQIDQLVLKKKMEQELDELEDCVDAAFAVIDQDRDGLITHNDVYRLMIHLGEVLWDNQVAAILDAADIDGDGRISKKDLFLFLLGQEKRVKLEDQILNKLANKEEPEGGEESKSSSTTEQPKEEAKDTSEKEDTTEASPSEPVKNLAATLKDAQATEDSRASARRRKMFSGYAKLVISNNRVANNVSDSAELSVKGDDKDGATSDNAPEVQTKEPADSAGVEKAALEPAVDAPPEDHAEKPQTETNAHNSDGLVESENQDLTKDEEVQPQEQETSAEDKGDATVLPLVNLSSSDWSDSGHAGSDAEHDVNADDSDEEFECVPLALEAGICYLPAPVFDGVASPGSSPCPSPRSASQGSHRDGSTPPACLEPSDHNLDPTDAINSARTERTSEYDSDRDGDGDSLPETSQQNLILQEIEQQVLHTKEALKAKESSLGGVQLKEKYAAMLTTNDSGDGCESVVESEILPTYVPPCARYARSGLRLSSDRLKDVADLGQVIPEEDIREHGVVIGGKERSSDKDQQGCLDTLTADDYANSTAEIISKGYVSLSSPRSASTMTTKFRLNDITDDVFSPLPHDSGPQCDFPRGIHKTSFAKTTEIEDRSIQAQDSPEARQTEAADEDWDDSSFYGKTEDPVDGVPLQMRPCCDRSRKLSARSRPKSPLRRSLTCHTVTVKDLSASLHRSPSPLRRDKPVFANRKPFVRSRSSHLMQSDSNPDRRDSSHSRRDLSAGRTVSVVKMEVLSARTPATLKRQQTFNFRRTQSLSRMNSPQRYNDPPAQRTFSPMGRMDSHRSQSIDSPRTQKESSRRQANLSHRESARSRREPSRSGRETGRSQLESHHSRQESFRARSASAVSTARSGGQTNRSTYDDDEEYESEEEFRFYGPNFDLIMSQKGEPEELLRESLLRDAILRAGAQHSLPHETNQDTVPHEDCLTAVESRNMKISRQLERVKAMERLIIQRREQMAEDDSEDLSFTDEAAQTAEPTHGGRRHPLRRARTALGMRTPHTSRSGHIANFISNKDEGIQQTVRPRSCLVRRRTLSTTMPKVVTIADDSEVPHPPTAVPHTPGLDPETDASRDTRDSVTQPAVHVVDLSSLLSEVSETEPSADPRGSPERSRTQSIRPLGRVLVAYEKARRRQAVIGSVSQDNRDQPFTTSISRQLQQGIPYRPPTPPHYAESSSQSPSPYAPRCSSAHVRKCSFMLGAVQDSGNEEQPPLVRSVPAQDGLHSSPRRDQRLSRESMTSNRARPAGDRTALTFDFPQRSVCVVKGRPVVTAAAPQGSG